MTELADTVRKIKRRCAACNRVIGGRPNRLYCSVACRKKADRQRKTVPKNGTVLKSIPSVIGGSNGVLIATVAKLGYLGDPDDLIFDTTYGRGLWWTRYKPPNLIALQCDFRHIPEADGSVPVVCFDPPYISTGSRDTSSVDDLYDRYGLGRLKGWRAIRQLIDDGLAECARMITRARRAGVINDVQIIGAQSDGKRDR